MASVMIPPEQRRGTAEAQDAMSRHQLIYEELIDLLAKGGGPEAVIAFHSSEARQNRAWDLADRNRAGTLTAEEAEELRRYLDIEHIMQMAKVRALMLLKQKQDKNGIQAGTL